MSIAINLEQWNLEDLARMRELGFEHIALTKAKIDASNQKRNNTIQRLDEALANDLNNIIQEDKDNFYAESPGMIIDRVSILFIKLDSLRALINLIEESDVKEEYVEKEKEISNQINDIGAFLDNFFLKISEGKAFFKIQKPIKIYNDVRLHKYIKSVIKEDPFN